MTRSGQRRAPGAGAAVWGRLRATAALAIVAVAVACAGCGAARGRDEIKANMEEARREETPEKLFGRGRAFAGVRDYTRAEQYFSAAIAAGAPPEKVIPLLLRVCIEENRYRAALLYADPYLKSHPDDWRLRFVVASLYATIGEHQVALDHLQQIAEARPDHAEVHYAMAVIFRDDARDPARADAHFREYLRLAPEGEHAAEARGSLLKEIARAAQEPASPSTGAGAARRGDPGAGAARAWRKVP